MLILVTRLIAQLLERFNQEIFVIHHSRIFSAEMDC